MTKNAPREVWINDIQSVEIVDGAVRIVLTCTRDGEEVPVLAVVGQVSRAPDMIAKVLNALQGSKVRLVS